MKKRGLADWIHQPKINQILLSFSVRKTPREIEKELGIKKLKLKPFVEKHLLKCLNPGARKGRLYVLTNKARRLLKPTGSKKAGNKDWHLMGWIVASPKQRLVVLKVVDSVKRTSEEIRNRASRFNSKLTRISAKAVLNDLVDSGLVETELIERKRYYWISEKGRFIAGGVNCAKERQVASVK